MPIDHGYALPHTLEDVCFEWEFWPQAKIPYDDETKAYIAGLDVERDAALLRAEGIELSPASERVLRVCTVLLQKAAQRGCCPADIAGMMSRPMPNRASDLEKLASRAAAAALGGGGPGASAAAPSPVVDAWRALDGNADAESRFLSEYAHLLDSYLEGFEPELAVRRGVFLPDGARKKNFVGGEGGEAAARDPASSPRFLYNDVVIYVLL